MTEDEGVQVSAQAGRILRRALIDYENLVLLST